MGTSYTLTDAAGRISMIGHILSASTYCHWASYRLHQDLWDVIEYLVLMLSRGRHSTIFWDVSNKQHTNSRCHVHPQWMTWVTKELGKFRTQRKRYGFLYNWKEKEVVKTKRKRLETTSVITVLRNVFVLPPALSFLCCFIPHHFSSGSTCKSTIANIYYPCMEVRG